MACEILLRYLYRKMTIKVWNDMRANKKSNVFIFTDEPFFKESALRVGGHTGGTEARHCY